MESSSDGTWIAQTAEGVVIARLRAETMLVDRPSLCTFRAAQPRAFEGEHLHGERRLELRHRRC